MSKPVVLTILDGLALRKEKQGNAVYEAKKENLLKFWNDYSHTSLRADGLAVGLPKGQMGNSEVGHMNMGAGRTIFQSLVLINNSIETGEFFNNEKYLNAINKAKENKSALHIMGLLSDGGVHSHINHIKAMIKMASDNNVEKIYVHAFLDGRDVDPKSAKKYIKEIQNTISENSGELASVSGRYYSMDRDKRWDRVKKSYDSIIIGDCDNKVEDFISYIDDSYAKDILDEFVEPAISLNYEGAKDNDSFIFMNFRPDRATQLSGILTNPKYDPKPEEPIYKPDFRPQNIYFVQTMKYSDDIIGDIAFEHAKIKNTLGEVVSNAGLKQLRIAETEKYPHVTFFFDGGVDKELEGSKRVLINSPKVATYDLKPEMSAYEVTDNLLKELDNDLDLVILNFANPDMVGHSGKLKETIKAIEVVDECMGKIYSKVMELEGTLLITADHGNSEKVINEDGTPNTAHTINPVPFVLVDNNYKLINKEGTIADIAPTILSILNINKPSEMTGISLLDNN